MDGWMGRNLCVVPGLRERGNTPSIRFMATRQARLLNNSDVKHKKKTRTFLQYK